MSEAELFEAGQFAYSNSLAAFAIYITLLSGYIAVAYLALEMSTQRKAGPLPLVAELAVVVMVFCYLASLKFMWDIRHPKND